MSDGITEAWEGSYCMDKNEFKKLKEKEKEKELLENEKNKKIKENKKNDNEEGLLSK